MFLYTETDCARTTGITACRRTDGHRGTVRNGAQAGAKTRSRSSCRARASELQRIMGTEERSSWRSVESRSPQIGRHSLYYRTNRWRFPGYGRVIPLILRKRWRRIAEAVAEARTTVDSVEREVSGIRQCADDLLLFKPITLTGRG